MRKAVVDVDETLTHICTIDFDGDDGEPIDLDTCKLTKEDIETMAEAFVMKQLHDPNLAWDRINQPQRTHVKSKMIAALKSIGLEVED